MTPAPSDLRIEYLKNPYGVDILNPRFSWKLNHPERNQWQTAYQILVTSSKELAQNAMADYWDSGKVTSDQTVNIAYRGKALEYSSFIDIIEKFKYMNSRGC